MAKQVYHAFRFKVQGRGYFPVDMLRYDCCVPRTQDDVSAAFTNEHDLRTVELTGFAARGIRLQPTDARWASFGWSVIAGSVQEVMGC